MSRIAIRPFIWISAAGRLPKQHCGMDVSVFFGGNLSLCGSKGTDFCEAKCHDLTQGNCCADCTLFLHPLVDHTYAL